MATIKNPRPKTFAALREAREDQPLTLRQQEFVSLWAGGDSIHNAALRAGFDEKANYGHKLRTMPHIQKAYRLQVDAFQRESQITRADVLEGLKDSIEMARLMSEPATMIAGWREIGKMCGFYEPKKIDVNVNVNGSVAIERMNKMSDAELLKIIEEASLTGVDQALIGQDHDDGDEESGS
jgi:hypothetical protein